MKKRTPVFFKLVWTILILLSSCLLANAETATLAAGKFGQALDARDLSAVIAGRLDYQQPPITVELWAQVFSKNQFHILLASEPKHSAAHWELYTYAGSGFFSLYMPGYAPGEVKSNIDITDGRWHYLCAIIEPTRARLYVDAVLSADVTMQQVNTNPGTGGVLGVGQLVEGNLGCDGIIDEVRITRGVREPEGFPAQAFTADAKTIGLWNFDAPAADGSFADASSLKNPATCPLSRSPFRNPRWAPGSLIPLPPTPDLQVTRSLLGQALAGLQLPSLMGAASTRDGVLIDWEEQYWHLQRQISGEEPLPQRAAGQVYDRHALTSKDDGDALGVMLRRMVALQKNLENLAENNSPVMVRLEALDSDLSALQERAKQIPVAETDQRKGLYFAACALQRELAFCNPLLDFNRILFVARGVYAGSRWNGPTTTQDSFGQHFATQYYGFNSVPGGGLFVLENYKDQPELKNLLADVTVENGRWQGQQLKPGAYLSPDLSWDGNKILFSWTPAFGHKWEWTPENSFSIFSINSDGANLQQLTDSKWDDFDATWLPDDRVVFISQRRGGYIRCFSGLEVPQHTMHTMKADGTDIQTLSYFETNEWHPSVNNDGMLVYTRWDYVDRENCLGSNIWTCYPDGRDARAPHGNYPYPWHTYSDNTIADSRFHRPYTEMNIRAIPGSHRYILTGAPHHGEAFGSLAILDLRLPDDGDMSQLRRITPYAPFPETEFAGRSQYPYGTPWPLNEDFYLCNLWENLYLIDRYGNQTLLLENSMVFDGKTDINMRLIDPIPLQARPRPTVIPRMTTEGEDYPQAKQAATVGVVNVYTSDQPFPKGTKIKWLRVIQDILKLNPDMNVPAIGYQAEATPRIPLGIVPVEEDGSAYFEAPPGKELIYQVLDENFMAVQSMRAVSYLHKGEQLTCLGCHEDKNITPPTGRRAKAFSRAPSKLQPEIGPIEPITYYRHAKPVFEKTCLPCHQKAGKGLQDFDYWALEPYTFHFDGGMSGSTIKPDHGGSRTIPGRFGARYCTIGQALLNDTHRGKIAEADYRKLVLWMDCNSLRLGAFQDEEKQMAGEVVWPTLDVDPANPLGIASIK